ncbi:MAG: DUF805 domain-containing protein [Prevotella sp.]|nr:DUF805 domain-containing protein [Prevotella sp.]MBR6015704.1 DUF805 domain-containing protein [Prevotella sp.]
MNEFIENFKEVMTKKYATFNGRAGLKEYWYFFVVNLAVVFSLYILMLIFMKSAAMVAIIGGLSWLWSLALLIPGLALTVRRLHDTGKGGGWIFIALIPILGALYLLYLMIIKGEPTANRFGEPVE